VLPVSSHPTVARTTPEDIVRQLTHLPSAPRVLPKLKRLLSDSNSSLHEVVDLVRLDPGIAARVLQVGNSAYYNQGLRCYTVDEAVHRVGYDQIYELVSTAVASEVLVRPLAAYAISADDLWRSSVACALAAETLAERLGIDCDIAYTIGLLHRVGLVAINDWVERGGAQTKFEAGPLPFETCDQERRLLGFHNAEAGAALLRLWDFPAVMSEPVRWQYLPTATAAHAQLSSLLSIAKWVRTSVFTDANKSAPALPDQVLLRRTGVSGSQLSSIVEQVRERLRAIGRLLDETSGERCTLSFPAGSRDIIALA
jgi:HD-like signal output (HDOD) protein